jgi:hypothetical protein
MRKYFAATGAFAALVTGLAVVLTASAGTLAGKPVIKSVSVSGTPAKPVFTIRGRRLAVPKPNPKVSPSNTAGCPVKINGNAGFDYGTQMYVDAFATATGEDKQLYSAGRYRPSLNETDCIGLIVLTHTAKRVKFTFGSAYTQFRSQYRTLRTGDLIEVVLKGAAFGLVVHYH